mmetsp:Transcript_52659/g.104576  ORF Transcript_52659/g.104576 Transcript_52659/m.104576 type:complete len:326 (+) Transcript_52659:70-1047(+)
MGNLPGLCTSDQRHPSLCTIDAQPCAGSCYTEHGGVVTTQSIGMTTAPSRAQQQPGEVLAAFSEIFRVAGVGAYHTSIIIGDKEYFFDSCGIESAPCFSSHLLDESQMMDPNLTTQSFGRIALTGEALVKGLTPFFEAGTYDIIFKNCNAFTDAAIYFLTRQRLDPQYTRMERLLQATTPVSTAAINGFVRANANPTLPDGVPPVPSWEYESNPLAQGFSVEDVIAACDALDAQACPQKRTAAKGISSFGCFSCHPCCERSSCDQRPGGTRVVPLESALLRPDDEQAVVQEQLDIPSLFVEPTLPSREVHSSDALSSKTRSKQTE